MTRKKHPKKEIEKAQNMLSHWAGELNIAVVIPGVGSIAHLMINNADVGNFVFLVFGVHHEIPATMLGK